MMQKYEKKLRKLEIKSEIRREIEIEKNSWKYVKGVRRIRKNSGTSSTVDQNIQIQYQIWNGIVMKIKQ